MKKISSPLVNSICSHFMVIRCAQSITPKSNTDQVGLRDTPSRSWDQFFPTTERCQCGEFTRQAHQGIDSVAEARNVPDFPITSARVCQRLKMLATSKQKGDLIRQHLQIESISMRSLKFWKLRCQNFRTRYRLVLGGISRKGMPRRCWISCKGFSFPAPKSGLNVPAQREIKRNDPRTTSTRDTRSAL